MIETPAVLLVDDDSDALLSLHRALRSLLPSVAFEGTGSAPKALERAKALLPPVVVLDLNLDDRTGVQGGLELLSALKELDPAVRVIVLTGHGGIENGIQALQRGAANFLEKPADLNHLRSLILDGITQAHLYREHKKLRDNELTKVGALLVGSSAHVQSVRDAIEFVGSTSQPVLITGETGTGKGVVAELIHRSSSRQQKPFIRYQPNFASGDLTNSELFGHVRGAFTGAVDDRLGLLQRVSGGTFFLDEIDELPPAVQVTLLGVLQDKRIRPMGGTSEVSVDFRLVSATNQDPDQSVSSGKLRLDLLHRLAHERIHLLPLRERLEDMTELAAYFVREVSRKEGLSVNEVAEEGIDKLKEYNWPGNVRELQAAIERSVFRAAFAGRQAVLAQDIVRSLGSGAAPVNNAPSEDQDFHTQVENFKYGLIQSAIKHHQGNQVKAAEALKLDRSTMRRFLARMQK